MNLTKLEQIFDNLWPVNRSITGPGLRESLHIIQNEMPVDIERIPSGTQVYDWKIPPEWIIKDARLTGPDGVVYADFAENNLSVVNYSTPVDNHMRLSELDSHLYSIESLPDATPRVTTYYNRDWGFCLPQSIRDSMPKQGEYHAYIDSELDPSGSLDFAHGLIEGDTNEEILLSTYLCHGSLANDNLSGPIAMVSLYNQIKKWQDRRYTYRFVIVPETIGSLAYLNRYGGHLVDNVISGCVLTCLGGPKPSLSYKLSREGDSLIDNVIKYLSKIKRDRQISIRQFDTRGSDERQYCSPGFNLPVGQFAKTVYGEYKEYHTSSDDKQFMNISSVAESINEINQYLRIIDKAGLFEATIQHGEPMLSKRELYPTINSPNIDIRLPNTDSTQDQPRILDMMRLINFADGNENLIEAARKYEIPPHRYISTVELLLANDLLRYCTDKS